jgi:flavin-dependent dehydrogenase
VQQFFDFAVIGAGPAGVVTALELHRLGHRVALVHAPRRLPAVEGLAERACDGLAHAGCRNALATASAPVPRSAEWNGEYFDGNRERLVDRADFDRALLADARDAGIETLEARVTRTERDAEGWSLSMRGGNPVGIRAAYLVDARGRGAPKCPEGLEAGPRTFAIGRSWRLPQAVDSRAQVQTFRDGWSWLAVREDYAMLQIFVSTERRGLPPKSRLAAYYADLTERLPGNASLLASAKPVGVVFARSAGIMLCPALIDERQARVGEAALSIDPLAGHGMFEAVGCALALAAALNTMKRYPERSALAMDFYRERVRHDFWRMARTARDFYRLEQRWNDRDFWRERQRWPDDLPSHESPSPGRVEIERRAVNDSGIIVERDVVLTPDHPRGVWRLAGVELVALWRILDEHRGKSGDEIAILAAPALDAPPDAVRQALQWLRLRGVLKTETPPGVGL